LALIAGCDIHINYHNPNTTLPNPVRDTNPLRPKEPNDTRPPYPKDKWNKRTHTHEYFKDETAAYNATWKSEVAIPQSIPCGVTTVTTTYSDGGTPFYYDDDSYSSEVSYGGSCDAEEYSEGKRNIRHTWWRGSSPTGSRGLGSGGHIDDYGIDSSTYGSLNAQWGYYNTMLGAHNSAWIAYDADNSVGGYNRAVDAYNRAVTQHVSLQCDRDTPSDGIDSDDPNTPINEDPDDESSCASTEEADYRNDASTPPPDPSNYNVGRIDYLGKETAYNTALQKYDDKYPGDFPSGFSHPKSFSSAPCGTTVDGCDFAGDMPFTASGQEPYLAVDNTPPLYTPDGSPPPTLYYSGNNPIDNGTYITHRQAWYDWHDPHKGCDNGDGIITPAEQSCINNAVAPSHPKPHKYTPSYYHGNPKGMPCGRGKNVTLLQDLKDAMRPAGTSPGNFPSLPLSLPFTEPPIEYQDSNDPPEYANGTVYYVNVNPHPELPACNQDGFVFNAVMHEYHPEYWVWDSWIPAAPDWPPQPWPTPKPASYPNGEPRDCVRTNSPPNPPDCTEDDAYCVSWPDWKPDPDLKWQPIDFSLPNNHDPYMGSPYHGPNTHMKDVVAADDTHQAHYKKDDLNHMSPDVPATTINLTNASHTITQHTHHGPDTPPKGGFNTDEFHPDYLPNTNKLDNPLNAPKTLVTRLFNSTTEHIGYASDHWSAYVMEDPVPLHELCDFMGFKLANVAILAPAGGLIADQWFLPRQTGNNPTIEIQGSITVKHRGLFARSDTNGNLTTGYRKHFTHPTDFEQGTTTWWPDIKQNHWTPQP
ncbi:MAG: hypothetical protein OXI96_04075, partial [Acidimicrobiaceae bacterium]|nr:hypothetical protein [Acidimicrobiaceae bacterium]